MKYAEMRERATKNGLPVHTPALLFIEGADTPEERHLRLIPLLWGDDVRPPEDAPYYVLVEEYVTRGHAPGARHEITPMTSSEVEARFGTGAAFMAAVYLAGAAGQSTHYCATGRAPAGEEPEEEPTEEENEE